MAEKSKKSKPSRTVKKAETTSEMKDVKVQKPEQNMMMSGLQNRRNLLLVLLFVVVAVLAYRFKSEYVVATVNGKPITRTEVISTLEKQAGQQALDGLIVQELIRQEAKKANIVVKNEDVTKQITELENQLKEQGQNLDEFLKAQGLTREDLTEQAELQLMLEKLTEKDTKVTQKEIDEAFEEQKAVLEEDEKMTEAELREQIENGLKMQKQSAAVQAWIDVARQKAKVNVMKKF